MASRIPALLAAVTATAMIAACGSSAPSTTASSTTTRSRANAATKASGLSYARCMRAHGTSRFPDPSASGGIDPRGAGVNLSSPAVKAAETACRSLLPEKLVPSQPPTARAYARLLAWAKCMRRHGISALPDPRPDPVPSANSPASSRFRTIMGDGGYWVGIPPEDDPHSPAFMRLSTDCGESPTGPAQHQS